MYQKQTIVKEVGCRNGLPKLIGFEGMERVSVVTLIAQVSNKGSQEKVCLLDCIISRNGNLSEMEPFVAWESEDLRKQQMNVSYSMTDWALKEEALRWEFYNHSGGRGGIPD
ncbi:hypothetical protein CK203_076297 [Vitis vinifera]|uniref:Uncharacterized protein n=1 Tax=Vitis vinifera TaxID=29760 RepID=A0A438E5D5_VITVI|nr:hypothetical protein CK203_076297 [Vitis vinifera]